MRVMKLMGGLSCRILFPDFKSAFIPIDKQLGWSTYKIISYLSNDTYYISNRGRKLTSTKSFLKYLITISK